MLENILVYNPSNLCAIIQDNDAAKGTDIFRALLKHDVENDSFRQIHLVCCDSPPEYYLNGIDNTKIIVHNLFEDPNCWLHRNQFDINTFFRKLPNLNNDTTTCMIDSLNFLINFESLDFTFRTIHRLKRLFKKIICVLHINEIICNATVKKFMYLSDVYVKLFPLQSNSFNFPISKGKSKLVEVIHVKPSGKITSFKEIIFIDENCHLKYEIYFDGEKSNTSTNIKDNYKNITTFRLGLDIKENERKARDSLILPYVRKGKNVQTEEGKIIYYADSDDDLEEDPDDDLNI